jgi:hypothetical protein
MRAEALILVANDHEAQRLAVAWDLLTPEERTAEDVGQRWAAMAGTTLARVEEKLEMLRRSEICTPEGTAEAALGFARQSLADNLKGLLS